MRITPQNIIRKCLVITGKFARDNGEDKVEEAIDKCRKDAKDLANRLGYKNIKIDEWYGIFCVNAFLEHPVTSPIPKSWREVLSWGYSCQFTIVIEDNFS